MSRVAVICGTGMSELINDFRIIPDSNVSELRIQSKWGEVPIFVVQKNEHRFFILDRHHPKSGARTPPHMIEHRANIFAISSCNPDIILSVNSVGSMREDFPPGDIGISKDIIDLTQIPWTFYDDEAHHSDRTSIFDSKAVDSCYTILKDFQNYVIRDLIIAQCTGPQFETPSEIDVLVKLGADVVGMTLGPEQRLVSETNIPHVALACSSNWAAGRTPGNPKAGINHNEVDSMASSMREKVMNCVIGLIEKF
jgi:5'-methylthioadenosine phosphorylase